MTHKRSFIYNVTLMRLKYFEKTRTLQKRYFKNNLKPSQENKFILLTNQSLNRLLTLLEREKKKKTFQRVCFRT